MKYAVLESGGKQYIAREGEAIEVDRLSVEVSNSIDFKDVLLVVENGKAHVGTPYVKGAKVRGTVVEQFKTPKVLIFKYIPKERYRRKIGHRQRYTRVMIDKISLAAPRKKTAPTEAAEAPKAKKPTSRVKAETTKPARSKKTEETKPTTPKKSTTAKKAAGSKAKGAQASKTSTQPKDKTTDKS